MKRQILYSHFIIICTLLVLSSCRLDVIEPESISAAINQPLQESRPNFLSYELNAENFSRNSSIPLNFNVSKATLYISLIGHSTGSVIIEIINTNQNIIFQRDVADNLPSFVTNFSETDFSRLKIESTDFSGKLIIRLTAQID